MIQFLQKEMAIIEFPPLFRQCSQINLPTFRKLDIAPRVNWVKKLCNLYRTKKNETWRPVTSFKSSQYDALFDQAILS